VRLFFELDDAAYTNGVNNEAFPLTINPIQGGSAANKFILRPNTTTHSSPTITGSVAGDGTIGVQGLLNLYGCKYVTIDGSNIGTNSKNLTFINNSTNTYAATIVWDNDASYDSLKNAIVKRGK